ncbi:MAG: TonB-dependent receptor domain-containing protein, partial [Bacteroidetes bacterium]|nr:TonB-dependent receptor domain-containing protein [Bacteroidota bacterium]
MEQLVLKGWVRILVAMTLVALVSSLALTQATGIVRGNVKDVDRSEVLIGANVVLTGTALGAVTDVEGNYIVRNVPEGTYSVSVRYVGYKGQTKEATVTANATATVDFALSITAVQMDEVVVTGQGAAIEKRRLPTTVETLSSKDIQNAPVKSVDQLLQGRIPGMQSFSPGGAPGTGARIITRGIKSALNSTTPVIYVDGIRVDNNPQGRLASGTGGQISSSLSDIVTGEIDRVEVIKGGAAATLFGSEAANGVIQIFTKKGTPGAARWNANLTTGYDAAQTKNVWSDFTRTNYFQSKPYQSYRVGAEWGTESLTYTVSGKMSENKGVSVRDQFDDKLYNLSVGLRALTGEKSSVEFSSAYTRNTFGKQFNDNAIASPLSTMETEGSIEKPRFIALRPSAANDAALFKAYQDSVLNAYLLPDLKETVNRWIASTNFNYNPYSWWRNKFIVGVDYRKSESRQFASIEAGPVVSTPGGYVNRSDREYMTLTANFNATLTAPDLGPISQIFTVGAQAFRVNDREVQATGTNFRIPGTQVFSNASVIAAAESNQELYSYGFIFQDQIGVGSTLFLDAGLRVDGNTTFGSNIKPQIYPKFGAAYNISDEEFYPEDMKSLISNLKLRASVGQTGNFPPPYTRDRSYGSTPYIGEAALTFGNPGNADLAQDKTTSYDIGFDMGLFDDRVSLDFSYYKQTTRNAQFNKTADIASGFTTFKRMNIGEIQNDGFPFPMKRIDKSGMG